MEFDDGYLERTATIRSNKSNLSYTSTKTMPGKSSYTVYLLDGQPVQIQIDRKSKGRDLFEECCLSLDPPVEEKFYFSLSFDITEHGNLRRTWIDFNKPVARQMINAPNKAMAMNVKFYPPDPTQLLEYTRYLFYLQLRDDVCKGKMPCALHTQAVLGSYVCQADVGDYTEGMELDFLYDFPFGPWDNSTELVEKIIDLWKTHIGLSTGEAELNYLENAKKLPMYGTDLHPCVDSDGIEIDIGINWSGVLVFRNKVKINRISWPKILKISYKRDYFYIRVRPAESDRYEKTVGFKMEGYKAAKRVWKMCVEHHAFFRLVRPDPKSKKIKFGSKPNLTFQTEYQLRKSTETLKTTGYQTFDRYNTMGSARSMSLTRSHPRDMDRRAASMEDMLDPTNKDHEGEYVVPQPGGRRFDPINQTPDQFPVMSSNDRNEYLTRINLMQAGGDDGRHPSELPYEDTRERDEYLQRTGMQSDYEGGAETNFNVDALGRRDFNMDLDMDRSNANGRVSLGREHLDDREREREMEDPSLRPLSPKAQNKDPSAIAVDVGSPRLEDNHEGHKSGKSILGFMKRKDKSKGKHKPEKEVKDKKSKKKKGETSPEIVQGEIKVDVDPSFDMRTGLEKTPYKTSFEQLQEQGAVHMMTGPGFGNDYPSPGQPRNEFEEDPRSGSLSRYANKYALNNLDDAQSNGSDERPPPAPPRPPGYGFNAEPYFDETSRPTAVPSRPVGLLDRSAYLNKRNEHPPENTVSSGQFRGDFNLGPRQRMDSSPENRMSHRFRDDVPSGRLSSSRNDNFSDPRSEGQPAFLSGKLQDREPDNRSSLNRFRDSLPDGNVSSIGYSNFSDPRIDASAQSLKSGNFVEPENRMGSERFSFNADIAVDRSQAQVGDNAAVREPPKREESSSGKERLSRFDKMGRGRSAKSEVNEDIDRPMFETDLNASNRSEVSTNDVLFEPLRSSKVNTSEEDVSFSRRFPVEDAKRRFLNAEPDMAAAPTPNITVSSNISGPQSNSNRKTPPEVPRKPPPAVAPKPKKYFDDRSWIKSSERTAYVPNSDPNRFDVGNGSEARMKSPMESSEDEITTPSALNSAEGTLNLRMANLRMAPEVPEKPKLGNIQVRSERQVVGDPNSSYYSDRSIYTQESRDQRTVPGGALSSIFSKEFGGADVPAVKSGPGWGSVNYQTETVTRTTVYKGHTTRTLYEEDGGQQITSRPSRFQYNPQVNS